MGSRLNIDYIGLSSQVKLLQAPEGQSISDLAALIIGSFVRRIICWIGQIFGGSSCIQSVKEKFDSDLETLNPDGIRKIKEIWNSKYPETQHELLEEVNSSLADLQSFRQKHFSEIDESVFLKKVLPVLYICSQGLPQDIEDQFPVVIEEFNYLELISEMKASSSREREIINHIEKIKDAKITRSALAEFKELLTQESLKTPYWQKTFEGYLVNQDSSQQIGAALSMGVQGVSLCLKGKPQIGNRADCDLILKLINEVAAGDPSSWPENAGSLLKQKSLNEVLTLWRKDRDLTSKQVLLILDFCTRMNPEEACKLVKNLKSEDFEDLYLFKKHKRIPDVIENYSVFLDIFRKHLSKNFGFDEFFLALDLWRANPDPARKSFEALEERIQYLKGCSPKICKYFSLLQGQRRLDSVYEAGHENLIKFWELQEKSGAALTPQDLLLVLDVYLLGNKAESPLSVYFKIDLEPEERRNLMRQLVCLAKKYPAEENSVQFFDFCNLSKYIPKEELKQLHDFIAKAFSLDLTITPKNIGLIPELYKAGWGSLVDLFKSVAFCKSDIRNLWNSYTGSLDDSDKQLLSDALSEGLMLANNQTEAREVIRSQASELLEKVSLEEQESLVKVVDELCTLRFSVPSGYPELVVKMHNEGLGGLRDLYKGLMFSGPLLKEIYENQRASPIFKKTFAAALSASLWVAEREINRKKTKRT